MKPLMAALAGSFILFAAPALGQPAPTQPSSANPTARRHLGFFLRLDGGIGYMNSSASSGGVSESISGVSSDFGVAVGGAVAENFILAADLWANAAYSPNVTLGGASATVYGNASLVGLGLNLTYYFMPANVYLSVSPSLTAVGLSVNGVSSSTQAGFGGKIALGKEWWVGDHWGLGVAGHFLFSINNDQGPNPPTWTTLAGGVAFSATLN